jgi:hypothetical protein
MPISSRLAQQLRQLGDIHRDPPRLMRQPLGFTFQPWIDALTYSSGVANLHYSSAGRFYSIDLPGARPSNWDTAMLTVTIWNQITTEFFGRSVYGSYVIENDAIITVKTPRGQKAMQLRGLRPERLAEQLLRELAASGKA